MLRNKNINIYFLNIKYIYFFVKNLNFTIFFDGGLRLQQIYINCSEMDLPHTFPAGGLCIWAPKRSAGGSSFWDVSSDCIIDDVLENFES